MSSENNEELIADLVAKKTSETEKLQSQARFTLGFLKKRIEKLVRQQERLEIEAGEEMVMGKAEAMETKQKINDLYKEIAKVDEKKIINEEELRRLEKRLESIEAILPDEATSKN